MPTRPRPGLRLAGYASRHRYMSCGAGESVILHGPADIGKTRVARALGHLAIRSESLLDRLINTSRQVCMNVPG